MYCPLKVEVFLPRFLTLPSLVCWDHIVAGKAECSKTGNYTVNEEKSHFQTFLLEKFCPVICQLFAWLYIYCCTKGLNSGDFLAFFLFVSHNFQISQSNLASKPLVLLPYHLNWNLESILRWLSHIMWDKGLNSLFCLLDFCFTQFHQLKSV